MKIKKCPFCKDVMSCVEDYEFPDIKTYGYRCYSCHIRIELQDLGCVLDKKKALLDAFVEKILDDYEGE